MDKLNKYTGEIFRWIDGYEGQYSVSNFGCVFSYKGKGKHLKTLYNKGYAYVLLQKDGKAKYSPIHRLVLTAFEGNPPFGFDGSHIDNNKSNNYLCNLKWESRKDNINRKREHGTMNVGIGERQHLAKLDEIKVIHIRETYSLGSYTQQMLADIFGVNRKTINAVVNRKTWKHVK